MLQDPNVERYIESQINPLRKEIEKLKLRKEIEKLKLQIEEINRTLRQPIGRYNKKTEDPLINRLSKNK